MNRTILLAAVGALTLFGCADPDTVELPDTVEGNVGGGGGGGGENPGDFVDRDGEGPGNDGDGHGGGGEPDDDSGSDGHGGGGDCFPEGETHVLKATPASVMLVLDKSGSMAWTWDHDENPDTAEVSKWASLHGAVEYILETFGERMAFGAQLFPMDAVPDSYEAACMINPVSPEVPAAVDNMAAIMAGIPDALAEVHGGTPASKGFDNAVAHLLSLSEDSPKHVVLVTDGAANCKEGEEGSDLNEIYDDTLPARVALAREQHRVLTHTIGVDMVNEYIPVPATNPWASLNEVAAAGGAPKAGPDGFYNVVSGIELEDAMNTISAHIECTVTLDDEILLPDTASVTVNGAPVDRVADCSSEDGWTFTTAEAPFDAVQLCGAVCDPALGETVVALEYGCP